MFSFLRFISSLLLYDFLDVGYESCVAPLGRCEYTVCPEHLTRSSGHNLFQLSLVDLVCLFDIIYSRLLEVFYVIFDFKYPSININCNIIRGSLGFLKKKPRVKLLQLIPSQVSSRTTIHQQKTLITNPYNFKLNSSKCGPISYIVRNTNFQVILEQQRILNRTHAAINRKEKTNY